MKTKEAITDTSRPRINRTLAIAIAIGYGASLFCPAYCVDKATASCDVGLLVLAFGWIGIVWGFQISWFANPLIGVAWLLLFGEGRVAAISAMLLTVLAVGVGNDFLLRGVAESENGVNFRPVSALGPGYWLWMGSFALTFVLCVVKLYQESESA